MRSECRFIYQKTFQGLFQPEPPYFLSLCLPFFPGAHCHHLRVKTEFQRNANPYTLPGKALHRETGRRRRRYRESHQCNQRVLLGRYTSVPQSLCSKGHFLNWRYTPGFPEPYDWGNTTGGQQLCAGWHWAMPVPVQHGCARQALKTQ